MMVKRSGSGMEMTVLKEMLQGQEQYGLSAEELKEKQKNRNGSRFEKFIFQMRGTERK